MGKNKKYKITTYFLGIFPFILFFEFFFNSKFREEGSYSPGESTFWIFVENRQGLFFFHNIFHNNFFTINHPLLAACQG